MDVKGRDMSAKQEHLSCQPLKSKTPGVAALSVMELSRQGCAILRVVEGWHAIKSWRMSAEARRITPAAFEMLQQQVEDCEALEDSDICVQCLTFR